MTMVQREQLDLMASFMHDYVGGTAKAAKAMASEIGDLRVSMEEQGAQLRASVAAQSGEMRSSLAEQRGELRVSMEEQGKL